eukprot:TCONS_00014198-protein
MVLLNSFNIKATATSSLYSSSESYTDVEFDDDHLPMKPTIRTEDMLARCVRKRPVATLTVCVLVLWLIMLCIVSLKTIDLEIDRVELFEMENFGNENLQQDHDRKTGHHNLEFKPEFRNHFLDLNFTQHLAESKTKVVENLEVPPIELKRKDLIRGWLNQKSVTKSDQNNTESWDGEAMLKNWLSERKNVGTSNHTFNKGNEIPNSTLHKDILQNPMKRKLHYLIPNNTKLSSNQTLHLKNDGKDDSVANILNITLLGKNVTLRDLNTILRDENITFGHVKSNLRNNTFVLRKRKKESHFHLSKIDLEKLKKNNKFRENQQSQTDNTIPNLLQSEIGPISNYTDKVKDNENLKAKQKIKFTLPYWEKSSLFKDGHGRTSDSNKDTTNPEAVRNPVGPVADYGEGNPNPEPVRDWMFYFGHRAHEDDWT